MSIFNKNKKATSSVTDFEKAFVNKKEKQNPVVKAGSIVLYLTVIVAVVACILMAVLDKSGVAPSPLPQTEKTAEKAVALDVSQHPESLKKLYSENFETADFVADYFDKKDKPVEVSLKKYKRSREIPLFIQWDKQWGYLQYGDDLVGVNGDGPMCIAMVGYHLTKDEKFSPDKVITFAQENGFYKKDKGTLSTLMTDGASKLGLVGTEIKAEAEGIIAALSEKKPVICLIDKGEIAVSAHYVVIREYDDSVVYINDPTSIVNSEKQWSLDSLIGEMKGAWVISQ